MPQRDVILNGRPYPVAYEEGQQKRLSELVAYVDAKARQIAMAAPNATEGHILALTCLLLADEALDIKSTSAQPKQNTENFIEIIESLTRRLEDIAGRLERS